MFQGNRVEVSDIEAAIKKTAFLVIPDTTTTICTLTLDNGYTVRGEASCVDPKNYEQAIGERYALEDAKRKIWPLLGFRLADRLSGANRSPGMPKELGMGYGKDLDKPA